MTESDKSIAEKVLEDLKGYGAKILTDIAYKTAPMKKISAEPGGVYSAQSGHLFR